MHSCFTASFSNVPFNTGNQFQISRCFRSPCHFSCRVLHFLQPRGLLGLLLIFLTWTPLNIIGHLFYRIGLSWGFSDVPRNSSQVFDSCISNVLLCSFDCILSGGVGFDCPITDVVNTLTWLRGILHFNDILPSQLLDTLWKDTLRLCNYPAPYHTSNVFIDSYQEEPMVSYFIQWDKVIYSHYLDIAVVPDLAIWEPLQAACCVLVICAHHSVSILHYFLAQQDIPDSSCTFPVLNL